MVMLFAEAEDVCFADQRLAACVNVHVYTQRFALSDDAVQFLKAQVQPIAVFSGPAALAVKVAGTGGVHEYSPWDITIILFSVLFLERPAN